MVKARQEHKEYVGRKVDLQYYTNIVYLRYNASAMLFDH